MTIPVERVRVVADRPIRRDGDFVLYWMTAHRRLSWNFALDRAVAYARTLSRPLVILEGVRVGYEWASDRHHSFILDGMAEHAAALAGTCVHYVPWVESAEGEGRGLIDTLSQSACVVVTDDYPAFFLPRMIAAAGRRVACRLEAIDANGLLPLSVPGRTFTAAYHFRRFLQKTLPAHLGELPSADPLRGLALPQLVQLPDGVGDRWPGADLGWLAGGHDVGHLPIDHSVAPVSKRGGTTAARARLDAFLTGGFDRYADTRNHPDADGASGLSPWLHFGHLSAHEVFHEVTRIEGWSPLRLSSETLGKREGWWGMSRGAEAFLDQLVTWRELGFGYCREVPGFDRYETLPEWARSTLADHDSDPREHVYTLDEFASAATHDPLWNAAQRQLLGEGVIHNYLRMLWGKKILEWTASPQEALATMIELNDRFAIDGRDPNSYSGIFWTLGRFDRGWPERAIYGKVRSMSSDSTRRKVPLTMYLERWRD